MQWKNSCFRTLSLVLTLTIGVGCLSLPSQAVPTFTPAPGRRLPGRREGAGTRGPCMKAYREKESIYSTALVPETNLTLTLSEYPTFFLFVPPTNAKTMEFTLSDMNRKTLYRQTLATPAKAGVVAVSLPKNELLPMDVNKLYQWSFTLKCSGVGKEEDIRLSGWIQRVSSTPALSIALEQATPRSRASVYAANGIWQDTLTTLADLRRSNPRNPEFLADWTAALQSIKLGKLAQEPLAPQ